LPRSSYPDFEQQVGFFDRLLENVRAIPGVTSASAVSFLPLAGPGAATSYRVDARPEPLPGEAPVADVRAIRADYFKTMSITLRRGRAFDGRERAGDALFPIVINEWMANEIWPGEDPLGKRITMNWFGDMHAEVIGLVDNVRHQGPDMIPRSIIYWAHAQFPYAAMYLTVAASGEPEALTPALRRELQAIDPQVPLGDVRTMVDRLGIVVAQRRFNMLLLGALAIVAALMAAVGIYGVMSYAVKQRWREMGLRVALGAQPRSVIRLIVTQGMVLTGIAVVVGTVAALVAARLLASFMSGLLFEVPSTDPVTFAAVVAGLSAVALVACYLPARRAMDVDPIQTLRVE
jgi:putative ABC transport system permease protein